MRGRIPAAEANPVSSDPLSGLHATLRNKGDYLYRTASGWSLSRESGHTPVQFLTLAAQDAAWPDPHDTGEPVVLVFRLKQADLTRSVGQRIADYLAACREKGIDAIVARPLPPEILPAGFTPSDLGIPAGCAQCLDLFRLETDGSTLLCDGSRFPDFRFTRSGRPQLHEYFDLQGGETPARLADGTESSLTLLQQFACTEPPAEDRPDVRAFDFPAYWVGKVGWRASKLLTDFVADHGSRLKGGPVLDDGGGHGKDSFFLEAKGFSPVLVDLNADLLRFARQRRDAQNLDFPIIHCDGRHLPFPDGSFSGVYSGGVMHHALTPDGMQHYLDEASRVLMPDGLFFGNVWARWDGEIPHKLLLLESQEVFETMLAKAGLHPIEPIQTRNTPFEAHKHMWVFVCEKTG